MAASGQPVSGGAAAAAAAVAAACVCQLQLSLSCRLGWLAAGGERRLVEEAGVWVNACEINWGRLFFLRIFSILRTRLGREYDCAHAIVILLVHGRILLQQLCNHIWIAHHASVHQRRVIQCSLRVNFDIAAQQKSNGLKCVLIEALVHQHSCPLFVGCINVCVFDQLWISQSFLGWASPLPHICGVCTAPREKWGGSTVRVVVVVYPLSLF